MFPHDFTSFGLVVLWRNFATGVQGQDRIGRACVRAQFVILVRRAGEPTSTGPLMSFQPGEAVLQTWVIGGNPSATAQHVNGEPRTVPIAQRAVQGRAVLTFPISK